jgi:hypothetical protein
MAAGAGAGAGLRTIRFGLARRDLRAAFFAGLLAFFEVRRAFFLAAVRLRPADLLRPRTLRDVFERVLRFAMPSALPISEPLESVAL